MKKNNPQMVSVEQNVEKRGTSCQQ